MVLNPSPPTVTSQSGVQHITTHFPQRQTKPSGVETPHKRKKPGISTPCSTSWHGVNGLTYTHTQSWAIHLIVPAALMASLGSFQHHQNGNSHCSGRREAELERAAILEGKGQDQQIPRKTWLYCLHTCWGVCVCVRGVVSTCIRRHSVKIMHAQMHTGSFPLSVF